MVRQRDRTRHGASLIEAVIAAGLLAVVLTGVAPLVAAAVTGTAAARVDLLAEQLARQRLAQLQALTHVNTAGTIVSDQATGFGSGVFGSSGAGLALTGLAPLESSVAGWVDWLDQRGAWLSADVAPPPAARYRRRWGLLTGSGGDCIRVWVEVASLPASPGQGAAHASAHQCAWGAWP